MKTNKYEDPTTKAFNAIVGPFVIAALIIGAGAASVLGAVGFGIYYVCTH